MIDDLTFRARKAWVLLERYFKNKFLSAKNKYSEITPSSGRSFPFGKMETISFITEFCPDKTSRILDVGPGRGIYNILLRKEGYTNFDAVEIYLPYIEKFELHKFYQRVFHCNIVDFEYEHYDIIIMGDVIEHLRVREAQKIIKYAQHHCNLLIVAVPYKLKQIGSQLDGSGDHRQPDLTREIFMDRYPGFSLLVDNHQLGVFYSGLRLNS